MGPGTELAGVCDEVKEARVIAVTYLGGKKRLLVFPVYSPLTHLGMKLFPFPH